MSKMQKLTGCSAWVATVATATCATGSEEGMAIVYGVEAGEREKGKKKSMSSAPDGSPQVVACSFHFATNTKKFKWCCFSLLIA